MPRSCGRWPSPRRTGPSAATASCAARSCGPRRCRPARRPPAIPGLFVCATTTKAYDTDENRVLKAALAAIHRAAPPRRARSRTARRRGRPPGPPQRPAGRHACSSTRRWRRCPVVAPDGPGPRAAHGRAAGASTYRPALGAAAPSRRADARRPPQRLRRRAHPRPARPVRRHHRALEAVTGPTDPSQRPRSVTGDPDVPPPGRRDDHDHVDGITIGGSCSTCPTAPRRPRRARAAHQRDGRRRCWPRARRTSTLAVG